MAIVRIDMDVGLIQEVLQIVRAKKIAKQAAQTIDPLFNRFFDMTIRPILKQLEEEQRKAEENGIL